MSDIQKPNYFRWKSYTSAMVTTDKFYTEAGKQLYALLTAKNFFLTSYMKRLSTVNFEVKLRPSFVKRHFDVILTPKFDEQSPTGVAVKITTNAIEVILCECLIALETEAHIRSVLEIVSWLDTDDEGME